VAVLLIFRGGGGGQVTATAHWNSGTGDGLLPCDWRWACAVRPCGEFLYGSLLRDWEAASFQAPPPPQLFPGEGETTQKHAPGAEASLSLLLSVSPPGPGRFFRGVTCTLLEFQFAVPPIISIDADSATWTAAEMLTKSI